MESSSLDLFSFAMPFPTAFVSTFINPSTSSPEANTQWHPQPAPYSNTEDLAASQLVLSQKLKEMLQEAFGNRTVLTYFVQQLPTYEGDQAIEEVTMAVHIAYNMAIGQAESHSRELTQPGEPNFMGGGATHAV